MTKITPASPLPEGIITIYDHGIQRILAYNTIIRLEAHQQYTAFYVKGPRETLRYLSCKNLGWYESQLPSAFFIRTHRTHIINLFELVAYTPTGRNGVVTLSDKSTVTISRENKPAFLRSLKSFTSRNNITVPEKTAEVIQPVPATEESHVPADQTVPFVKQSDPLVNYILTRQRPFSSFVVNIHYDEQKPEGFYTH